MPTLMQQFDATQYDPSQGASQMPVGKHPVVIEASSIETNSKGDGGFLLLTLRIIDGPAKGQSGAYRLNLYNASQKAAEIAHRQMSALCHVIGVFRVQSSEQLHNLPFVVEVEPQKDTPQYTQVVRVFDMAGNEPGKAPANNGAAAQPQQFQQPQQQQPQQPAAAPAAAAWGQPAQGQPAPAPAAAPAAAWQQGGGQPAAGGQPAWGGGAAAPAPAAAPAAAWGGGGGQPAAGAPAPWGAPR